MAKKTVSKGSLMERIQKTSVIPEAKILTDSELYSGQEIATTDVRALNIALSGKVDGGLGSGTLCIAGPSRHFKSLMGLILAGAYLKKHPDGVLLFYDSEFGTPEKYFDACGIDRDRVMHVPVKNIEELKFDLVKQMEALNRGDRVFVFLDSIGNIASKKEVDDALNDKSVADMTRAKAIKSLFRMVTPYLTLLDIPFVTIAHTYECGTEAMKVQTPEGPMSLAKIGVGDEVLTTNGYEKVTYTTKHKCAVISRVTLEDGEILEFTEGHKFMVDGEWKEISELLPGDEIDCINTKYEQHT